MSDNYITEDQLQTIERMMMRHTWQDVTALENEVLAAMVGAIRGLRVTLDAVKRERDGFESWANTLESAGWHDVGECPYCKTNDARKSTDVLEPDVAKAVCYCGTCRRTWLETPAVRIVTVGSTVVLPAGPGMEGKSRSNPGTALEGNTRSKDVSYE